MVALGGGFTAGEDVLSFTNDGATMGNIAGSYNPATGELTLTSAGFTATPAEWTAAAGAILYYNTSDQPHTVTRDVQYTFTVAGVQSGGILGHINVLAANDSPTLDPSVTVTLTGGLEDAVSPPSGAVGTLVSALVDSANTVDPDGANAHDGSAAGPFGLAVVSADTTEGNWWFSTDNGVSWTRFAGAGLAAISATNALHLTADPGMRLYFQPTTADFNGAIGGATGIALSFRAWDQADGVANGTLAALPTDSALGTGVNTAASAYSAALKDLPETIAPVNDAPIAAGSAALAGETEDLAPSVSTVGSLFAGNFSDAADQQQTTDNPTGTVANTLAGVAIVGNTTPPADGAWRYSLNGTAWVDIPATGLSDSNALILSSAVQIEFVPAANFNGAPPPLTVRLIDSSSDVALTGTTFGANLTSGAQAITGVDVSGAHNGAATAVSTATVDLSVVVAPVNDAPVAAGTAALATETEDLAPSVSTVGSLFTGNFSDTADQQRTIGNPTGTVANTLAGVAIVGNTTPAADGTWRYSLDGTTWADIPATGLSDANALVLSSAVQIEFVPVANFNGHPPPLTVRLIDSSSDVALIGTTFGATLTSGAQAISGVDVSGAHNGAATAVSTATVDLSITVAPVNDAPIAAGAAALATETEDLAPSVSTVASLFGGNFSDTADEVADPGAGGTHANTLAGVAIVANTTPAADGMWRYSLDGTTWLDIPATGLSDGNALVLSSAVQIEFVPAANFNGQPPPLTVRLIDTSHDVALAGTTFGSDLASGAQAFSGIDVSGLHNGAATAVSAATVDLSIVVAPVNDAPIAAGTAALPVEAEDGTPSVSTVGSLFAGNFSDTADQQQTLANPTGTVANTLTGVAIVANTTPAAEGAWFYSTDGSTWVAIPTAGLSDGNALVLSSAVQIEFVPVANFNGQPPPLTVRLIDSSHDVALTGTTFGSDLASGAQAISNVDVSGLHNGAATAVSTATVDLSIAVAPVNDAPIATGAAALPIETEDLAPNVSTVGSLFDGNFTDTADQQQTIGNPAGSLANTLAGIAVVSNPAPESSGEWRYSTNGGLTWQAIGTDVSLTNALVLSRSVRLEFMPAPNYNGIPASLAVRLIDSSTVIVSGTTTGAGLLGLPQAIAGVDISGAHSGGTTAVSAASVALSTAVAPVNDAPMATGTSGMGAESEDTAAPTQSTVLSLFTGNFSDAADQQRSLSNPFGSDANTLAGIAITGNTTPASEGVWRYSTDGGTTWSVVSTGVSATNALLLSRSVRLEFLPAANFNGIPVPLMVRLIDTSTDVALTGTLTGLTFGATPQAIAGVDVSGGHSGGNTAVSAAEVPLLITVAPVNDAPTAAGVAALAAGTIGSTPPSDTVANLFGPSFGDAVDQQRTAINPTGSVADSLAGVVVVGNSTPVADGVWQYSINGGASWTAVPTSVGDRSGLLLGSAVRLAFFPSATFSGSPPPLMVRLVDTSTDVPVIGTLTGAALAGSTTAISGIDVSGTNNGGTTAISVGLVPLTTSVSLPPPSPPPVGPPSGPSTTVPPAIVLPPSPSALFFGDGVLKDGGLDPGFLIGANVFRTMLATQSGTINVSADVFYGSDSSSNLRFEAKTVSGGPLPPWLYFDPTLLSFSGIPPLSAVGTLDLRIIATDRAGREAAADVHVIITRPPRDIMPLLRPFGVQKAIAPIVVKPPPSPAPPAPAPDQPAAAPETPPPPSDQPPPPPAPAPDQPNPQGALLGPEVWPSHGRRGAAPNVAIEADMAAFGLSAQLREQSSAGRLARARALLSALAAGSGPS